MDERDEVVAELDHVAGTLAYHCRQVMINGTGKWLAVAAMLEKAAEVCRNEAVIDG